MKKFYLDDEEKWEKAFAKDYSLEEPKIEVLKDGVVLPLKKIKANAYDGIFGGGVADENLKFVGGLIRKINSKDCNYSCIDTYEVDESSIKKRDEKVIFGGVIYPHFGHALLDSLSRLWYYVENPDPKKKIVFVQFSTCKNWFYSFTDLLGIKKEQIEIITEPTRFSEIIVPDQTMYSYSNYREKYQIIYQKMRESVTPSPFKKIYLTRTKLPKHDCVNEEYFEQYFEKLGYEIIAPEQYSIEEQIAFLAGADTVVCVMGTLAHLALFCKPDTHFIILNRTQQLNFPQILVSKVSKTKYTFIDVSMNFLPTMHANGSFLIGPTSYWQEYVKDHHLPKDDFQMTEQLCYAYLKNWCDNYSKPSKYPSIATKDISTLVIGMNQVFYSKKITRDHLFKDDNFVPTYEEYKKEIQKNQKDMASLVQKLQKAEYKLKRIENSRTWKWTKPFRMLNKGIHYIFR